MTEVPAATDTAAPEQAVDTVPSYFSADEETWGEDISPDKNGTLFKNLLREGQGTDTPLTGDHVSVHYEGRLLDQTMFDSSKKSKAPFDTDIGLGQVIKGWDAGIMSMKKGELCLLTCLPDMAYGSEGFQSSIPPNSTLQFEVELLSWHGMDCTKAPGGPEANVLKSMLREGSKYSATVKDSAEVTVNITGRYQDNVFFKEESFSFSVDECLDYNLPHGIEYGIKKMKKEEIAKLYIPPSYGFGDAGHTELGIPPNANLVYEIHLLSFINQKDHWEYDTAADRIEAATKFKARGTALLTKDRIDLALQSYEKGLVIVSKENVDEDELTETRDIRIALQLNISLCQAKKLDFVNQHKTCSKILEEDKDNLKATFRRGMACTEISEYEQSIADFNRVLELEPGNKGAVKLLDNAKRLLKGRTNKEKKMYVSMFSKAFTDPTQQEPAAEASREQLQGTKGDADSDLDTDSIDT